MVERREPVRGERSAGFRPARFPSPVGLRLRARLAQEHERAPFSPDDVRSAARRVVSIAHELELSAIVIRGGLDVGGAEVEHLWVSVDDRVVDVAFPLVAQRFVDAVRAYVAGELEEEDLVHLALPYSLEFRIVGDFPSTVRYYGAPIWSARDASLS